MSLRTELKQYLLGRRRKFSIKIDPPGTEFQKRVWRVTATIPYGSTMSYQALARRMGDEKSTRAVARALSQNPLPIFIPCHRVIAKNGSLGGFAWGLELKAWLLRHEAVKK